MLRPPAASSRPARGVVLAVLAGVAVVALSPTTRALEGSLLVAGALVLLVLVQRVRAVDLSGRHSSYELALRRPAPTSTRIGELERIERAVALANANAFDLHFRLRPILREIAAHRLARRGLELDGGSPAVPGALGDELWELVRPDRTPPDNRAGPGLPLPRLEAAVGALEAV